MNFDKNFEQSCGHFSTADLCHSTLTWTKLTDTYSKKLAHDVQQQTRLPGAPMERTSVHTGWLSGRSPAQWMQSAEDEWDSSQARESDVPNNPLARSSWSILGTLSLMAGSCEIPRLHKSLGPHRMVTQRHTQRLVKWLEEANWIHRQQNHVPFAEGQVFKLRDAWIGFARLTLAMWPFL